MPKNNKETIIDLEPDVDGIYKPVKIRPKTKAQPQSHRRKHRSAIPVQKTPLEEFKKGIGIGLEILSYFR